MLRRREVLLPESSTLLENRSNESDRKRIARMWHGDGLEADGTAAFRNDRVPTEKLIKKRLGLHRSEVNAKAHVRAAAERIVEPRVSSVLGSLGAEPQRVEAIRVGPPVGQVV